jgi:hypothetical protein
VVPAAAAPVPATDKPATAVTPEAFCEHFARLSSRCEALAQAHLDPQTCAAELRSAFAAPNHEQLERTAACVIDHDDCDAAVRCIADVSEVTFDAGPLRACADHSPETVLQAVATPRAEWDHRNGAVAASYRDVRSTKALPVEMCGVAAAHHWLSALRC